MEGAVIGLVILTIMIVVMPFIVIGAIILGIALVVKHIKRLKKIDRVLDNMDPAQAEEFKKTVR